HLPNGLVRQYSLTNGPGESGCYRIGVKLEPESTGGSKCLHETVRTGDVLAVSVPRNNFTLSRASERTVLLAGGIGITPLLSMAQTLRQSDLVFELHVFVRDRRFLPFPELVASFGDAAVEHVGLTPPQTASEINRILGEHTESAQLYVCGPAPMIEAAIGVADGLGWPERSVHFEYFANPTEIDDSSAFDVALARSGLTLRVEPAQTVLQALRAHDIDMPSSCEQGACGTCLASVLEGEILHQDVYLSRSERAAGDRMLTCVSRATSDRLVLDL
ncbi:MAG: PDR/VanB family oxidoreductase, partial [Acidimicrobiaceae bacterium]|nr:PDR/VanB family oxidoreductase [Acidimicrobiaceae bacterium]